MTTLRLVTTPPTKNSVAAAEALDAVRSARLNLDVLWANIRLHYGDRVMLDDLVFSVVEPLSYVTMVLDGLIDAKQESSSEP